MDPIVERILNLINKSGLTDKSVLEQSELSKSSISDWKKGKAKPSTDAIIKLATFFNVSTDFILLGKTADFKLPTADSDLLDLYHRLSHDAQCECIGYIKGYVASESNNHMESVAQRRKA